MWGACSGAEDGARAQQRRRVLLGARSSEAAAEAGVTAEAARAKPAQRWECWRHRPRCKCAAESPERMAARAPCRQLPNGGLSPPPTPRRSPLCGPPGARRQTQGRERCGRQQPRSGGGVSKVVAHGRSPGARGAEQSQRAATARDCWRSPTAGRRACVSGDPFAAAALCVRTEDDAEPDSQQDVEHLRPRVRRSARRCRVRLAAGIRAAAGAHGCGEGASKSYYMRIRGVSPLEQLGVPRPAHWTAGLRPEKGLQGWCISFKDP